MLDTLPDLLKPLNSDRVWWDAQPEGTSLDTPIVLLQQTGGRESWYVDKSRPDMRHARVLITVLGRQRIAVDALMDSIGSALSASDFVVAPYGAPVCTYDPDAKLREAAQSFGFWVPRG